MKGFDEEKYYKHKYKIRKNYLSIIFIFVLVLIWQQMIKI